MYNFMKKGAFMLLVACLAMGMASCSDDDPDYRNVTPPPVAVKQSIGGRVTGVDITSNNRPGELGDIRIRGNRSLTADNNPLYVNDGIHMSAG